MGIVFEETSAPRTELTPGVAVEVHKVWAGGALVPLKSWFKGYVFVRAEGSVAIVRHTEGLYKGIEVREPLADVRLA